MVGNAQEELIFIRIPEPQPEEMALELAMKSEMMEIPIAQMDALLIDSSKQDITVQAEVQHLKILVKKYEEMEERLAMNLETIIILFLEMDDQMLVLKNMAGIE